MKKTNKQMLVDHMLENGNDFRYTDMVKFVLKLNKGENYEYTREDRGYYSTNFSFAHDGYMVNGSGKCGIYKNSNGRWSAKYWTAKDKIAIHSKKIMNSLVSQTLRAYRTYMLSQERRDLYPQVYTSADLQMDLDYNIQVATNSLIRKVK